jgi:hypothetical protein
MNDVNKNIIDAVGEKMMDLSWDGEFSLEEKIAFQNHIGNCFKQMQGFLDFFKEKMQSADFKQKVLYIFEFLLCYEECLKNGLLIENLFRGKNHKIIGYENKEKLETTKKFMINSVDKLAKLLITTQEENKIQYPS